MYNDYYLEQINNKMSTNNSLLDDIKDNQEEIILNQEILISGDKDIINRIERVENANIMIVMSIMLYVIMYFIVRSLKWLKKN